ncbi:MAG TPA: general secretion pathway protein GspB [Steroidobacteraceae bacterium]|jgi:general secretion pathway protein B|nr:general secretion pathway protein GspB [Steroidobacteraceae bacterium]
MSFILDALKKSESARQRQSGPALFEVKVAPPRTRLPLWAIAIAALLVVNLGIVMWMLMRHSARAASSDAATPAGASVAIGALTSPAQPLAVPAAVVVPSGAPAPGGAPMAAGAAAAGVPAASAAATVTPAPAATAVTPQATPAGAAANVAAGAADAPTAEDYAPAAEPGSPAPGSHVRRGTAAGVPLYQEAAASPGTQIPELRLDLHVYAAQPQDRFVMINMHKLHEGESLPEGVHVDSITPDGAVLSYRGSRFLLTQN